MEYLLLWSGDVKGLEKARINSVAATGYHSDKCPETGKYVMPDKIAVRALLPYRLRKAFDRSQAARYSKPGQLKAQPWCFKLTSVKGRFLTQIYLQPLRAT